MFNSGILDTVIGVMFVFLLVSMLVTIGNEMISGALRSRAKWLRMGVERLLGSKWAKELYAHPLISGTAQNATVRKAADDPASNQGPSYIASRAFANVLMALLHDSAASVQEVRRALQSDLNAASAGGALTVDALQARITAAQPKIRALIVAHSHSAMADAVANDLTALRDRLKAPYTVADAQADIQRLIDAMPARYLRQMIEGIPDEGMRKILLALFDDAQGNVEKFKQNIEIWFNNAMDRVSGWYKRRAQHVIAALAVLAAVGMNVDAVLIFKHLQTYPGARDTLVAQARTFAASERPAGGELPAEFDAMQKKLTALGLPIGWVWDASPSQIKNGLAIPRDAATVGDRMLQHSLGWLITALAATLGAPFWFDTLNRVISIRSAGKAPEEKPKAPKKVSAPLEPGQRPREATSEASGH